MHFQRDSNLFVSQILSAVKERDINTYAIFNIRSEFLGDCTQFRSLPAAINEGQYLIPRMNRKERKLAVIAPIQKAGGVITEELINQVLNDTGVSHDHLPVLQHALMRVWDYWQKNNSGEPLDFQHYKAIGKMSGALSQHAEEVYRSLKHERQRHICEIMFKTIPEETSQFDIGNTSNTIKGIAGIANCEEDEVVGVADCFREAEHSFITPPIYIKLRSETPINLTHDSLVERWGRLSRWRDEESKAADLYIRLAHAGDLYQEGKAALWRDPELQFALQWRKNQSPNEVWAKRYAPAFERAMVFLDYSHEQNNLKIEQKQKRQKAQIRRSRTFAIIVGILGLIAIVATIYAFIQQSNAELYAKESMEQNKTAEENREMALLIGESAESKYLDLEGQHKRLWISTENIQQSYIDIKTRHDSLSSLYQLLVKQQDVKNTINDSLMQQIKETRRQMQVMEYQMFTYRAQFFQSMSDKLTEKAYKLLSQNKVDSASLFALYANQVKQKGIEGKDKNNILLHKCLTAKGIIDVKNAKKKIILPAKVTAITKYPGKKIVAAADMLGNVYISTSKSVHKLNIQRTIKALEFNTDGKLLAAGTTSGDVYIWSTKNIERGAMLLHKKTLNYQILDIKFTPTLNGSDHYLIVKTNKKILLFSVSPSKVSLMANFDSKASHLTTSYDGNRMYAVVGKKLVVYDIDYTESKSSKIFTPLRNISIGLSGKITSMACGKSSHIALGDHNGNVIVYDAINNYSSKKIPFKKGKVEKLNFDNEGEKLLVVRAPSDIRIYNIILSPKEVQKIVTSSSIKDAVWIEENNMLATSDKSNTVSFIQGDNHNYNKLLCKSMKKFIRTNKLSQKRWEKITGLDNSDGLNPVPELCD